MLVAVDVPPCRKEEKHKACERDVEHVAREEVVLRRGCSLKATDLVREIRDGQHSHNGQDNHKAREKEMGVAGVQAFTRRVLHDDDERVDGIDERICELGCEEDILCIPARERRVSMDS